MQMDHHCFCIRATRGPASVEDGAIFIDDALLLFSEANQKTKRILTDVVPTIVNDVIKQTENTRSRSCKRRDEEKGTKISPMNKHRTYLPR